MRRAVKKTITQLKKRMLLMNRGADVNDRGGLYGTALQAVSSMGYHGLVEYISLNRKPMLERQAAFI